MSFPFLPPERSPSGGASVGRGGTTTGGRAPVAQIRHLLRGVLPQRQIHRQRGKPARHDGQRLGVEGTQKTQSPPRVARLMSPCHGNA